MAAAPATRAQKVRTRPSRQALTQGERAVVRLKRRSAQIRRSFISRDDPVEPPLARALRGGRGGEVRIKLYLTLLWFGGGNQPYDVTFPARAMAELLDLEDPAGRGARRITGAIRWLEAHRLLLVERVRGEPSRLTLLDESGQGRAYRPPGEVCRELSDTGAAEGWEDTEEAWYFNRYEQLPPEFWGNGWIATLSASGVAILLVLMVLDTENNGKQGFWISPKRAKQRFALSEDTWTRGIKELERYGLIVVRPKQVSEDFGWKRRRNTFGLDRSRLKNLPVPEVASAIDAAVEKSMKSSRSGSAVTRRRRKSD
jgi:hypothetical protein